MCEPAKQIPLSDFKDTLLEYTRLKKTWNNRYGIQENGYFRGISYYDVDKLINDEILKIIPDEYRQCFKVFLQLIQCGSSRVSRVYF